MLHRKHTQFCEKKQSSSRLLDTHLLAVNTIPIRPFWKLTHLPRPNGLSSVATHVETVYNTAGHTMKLSLMTAARFCCENRSSIR